MKKLQFNLSAQSIETIWQWYNNHYLNFASAYQREFIWDINFKAELILSILKTTRLGQSCTKLMK